MARPKVSIIIPTLNSGRFLERLLVSIKKQSYTNIEIIVVDNNSSDSTKEIAKKYTKNVINKGPERSAQRNHGADLSRGKYIAWFDSDMQLTTKVISECVDKINKNPKIDALIVPEKSVGEGYWAKCKALEKQCYLRDIEIEGIRFIKRDVFFKVGKLSEKLISGEDWDITKRVRKAGYKIDRIESFVIHHEGRVNFIKDLKKKYYYATKSMPYIEKHVSRPRDILLFVFRPAFLRNWKLLLTHPLLSLGMISMKFLQFFVGFLGVVKVKYFR